MGNDFGMIGTGNHFGRVGMGNDFGRAVAVANRSMPDSALCVPTKSSSSSATEKLKKTKKETRQNTHHEAKPHRK